MAKGRAASRIGTEVVPARIVGHEHDDVGPFLLLLLLLLCERL
jgi:hypothetical protein